MNELNASASLALMYNVGNDEGLTEEEWPIPTSVKTKNEIIELVCWTQTPLDINLSENGTVARVTFECSRMATLGDVADFAKIMDKQLAGTRWEVRYQSTPGSDRTFDLGIAVRGS